MLAMAAGSLMAGCAAAASSTPEPRTIIIHSGARLRPDHERMTAVNEWVTREQDNISRDPSFWVKPQVSTEEVCVRSSSEAMPAVLTGVRQAWCSITPAITIPRSA